MVNEKILVSAQKSGDLLVRIPPERHDELTALPGVEQATMGKNRRMSPGWIIVAASVLESDSSLSKWLEIALEHNRTADDR